MSTPQVPSIPNSKAQLSAQDTETVLSGIFGIATLPSGKTNATVRRITITLTDPARTSVVQTDFK